MEGPTPVSALIHAATLVTAGVYLMLRVSPLLEYASTTVIAMAFVGAITAIFAATSGIAQTDIKRVIAYSTCSQVGQRADHGSGHSRRVQGDLPPFTSLTGARPQPRKLYSGERPPAIDRSFFALLANKPH